MAKSKKKYDYGECHVCGERLVALSIKQEFWIKEQLVVIEAVPAGVCPQCGEKVVAGNVAREVASLLADPKRRESARTLQVPVIRFGRAA